MNTLISHSCSNEGVVGIGPSSCDIMGIGIAAGRIEWKKTREPFTGSAGKLLTASLAACNIKREDIYLTNLCCQWDDDPSPEMLEACKPRLQREIETVNPKIILLFGTIVCEEILGRKVRRGKLTYQDGRWYLPMFHPAAFLHDKSGKMDIADMMRDLLKLKHGNHIWSYPPEQCEYSVIDSTLEASNLLHNLTGKVAIDIESSFDGLDFKYPDDNLAGNEDSKLLCFSVSNWSKEGEGHTYVIPGALAKNILPGWGANPNVEWIMQGGMFDKARLKFFLGEVLYISEDTLLQDYSLDERGGEGEEDEHGVGIHGLKIQSAEFLGADDYNVNVLEASLEDLHHYNALDAWYTRRLFDYHLPRQIEDNVRDMYLDILIDGANVLSEIQDYGVYIDSQKLMQLGSEWTATWLRLWNELQEEAKEKGYPDKINFNSWQQLQKFLFDYLKLKPHPYHGKSTNKEALADHAEKEPWCAKFLEWRQIDRIFTNYILAVQMDIKWDGRLRPQPLLHGSRSGRLSYKKPPIQTIPKHGVDPKFAVIRSLYAAPSDEYSIVEIDYKQAELWVTAYLSGDKALLEALMSGDAHGVTAKEVWGVDENHPNWSAYRELGKMWNFGTLYFRTAKGYAENLFQGRKPPPELAHFKWTRKQAQEFIDKWYGKYQDVRPWQKECIKDARTNGEQQTKTGRKRRYWLPNWKTTNQAVNLHPQSLAHDYLFDSLRKIHKRFKLEGLDSHVLFEVHDSILIETKKDCLDKAIKIAVDIMTEPKFGFPGLRCDISVGPNWYKVEKYAWNN